MSKKDYKAIAWIIKTCPKSLNDFEIREHLIKEFIILFKLDNPRFREDRFKEFINRKVIQ